MAKIKILPTLQRRTHHLSSTAAQLALLERLTLGRSFEEAAGAAGHTPLRAIAPSVLQLNVGKRCNQTCRHCHVDAGPDRREVMSDQVLEACLAFIENSDVGTVDITGGAPELHPRFRELVSRARRLGRHVIDRCNLTVTQLPSHADLPEFLAAHSVQVIASLPWYTGRLSDAQRGEGVFDQSIAALQRFNELGYGLGRPGLVLDLVTNPVGAYLPARQAALEADYRRELRERYGVSFDRLYTITNMPISRYLEWLEDSGNLESYMAKLVSAFNPAAVDGLMCRFTLSVGWDGMLYDCDFNQMLELGVGRTIFDVAPAALAGRAVRVGRHCFGCTAGAGSSCGGATAST